MKEEVFIIVEKVSASDNGWIRTLVGWVETYFLNQVSRLQLMISAYMQRYISDINRGFEVWLKKSDPTIKRIKTDISEVSGMTDEKLHRNLTYF